MIKTGLLVYKSHQIGYILEEVEKVTLLPYATVLVGYSSDSSSLLVSSVLILERITTSLLWTSFLIFFLLMGSPLSLSVSKVLWLSGSIVLTESIFRVLFLMR